MNTNPIDPVFLEAVQMKHTLGLKTLIHDKRFREVIVKPHYVRENDIRIQHDGQYARCEKKFCLWAFIPAETTNYDFVVEDILEWRILDEADLTSRKIPRKTYRDFQGNPFKDVLIEVDCALRRDWGKAANKPDFDPAPFIEKDKRLGEIAEEVRGWFPKGCP